MRNVLPFKLMVTIAAVGVLMTACSSSSTSTSSGASTSAPTITTTTVATTPTTTVPATTTPPSTVPAPAPIVLTLRGDGIGPFDLGVAASEVIEAVTAQFGPPTSDLSLEYPDDDGFGGFQDVTGEFGFFAQIGRTVCWAIQFCAEFGNNDPTSLFFAGWTYGEESGVSLASTSGVTIGTRWSDGPPTMSVAAGGCYSVGNGDVDGILLTLLSEGDPFSSFDDLGNYIEGTPAPEDVTVTYMQAGQVPAFLFGDC